MVNKWIILIFGDTASWIWALFLGFVISILGIIPPGLLNMTAARISLNDGQTKAAVFCLGASLVVMLQTLIAILFAKYLYLHPDLIRLLKQVGILIFIGLSFYFFGFAKKQKKEKEKLKINSKTSRFFLGMLLAFLNFLPIPYYVVLSISLSNYGYFTFEKNFVSNFVIGAFLGAFIGFFNYVLLFKSFKNNTDFFLKNSNYIIGSITAIVAIITMFSL